MFKSFIETSDLPKSQQNLTTTKQSVKAILKKVLLKKTCYSIVDYGIE